MRVSVIISNRNDVALLGVTIRSALEELSVVPGGGQVVIADNSDPEIQASIKDLTPPKFLKENRVKWVFLKEPCLFRAREVAARAADGEYIICIDSHCLFGHNSIIDAVHFMNRMRNRNVGFGSIPINWLCQHERSSKHDMQHLHGTWGNLYKSERKITWKGMPWICRKDWFLNTLNGYGALSKHMLSWGGGDMYLGLKSHMIGYDNWAIPTRAAIHIGPLPNSLKKFHKYRLYNVSGKTQTYIGWLVALRSMGGDKYVESKQFIDFLKKPPFCTDARIDVEQYTERDWFKEYAKMSFEELETKLKKLSRQPTVDEFDAALADCKKVFNTQKAIKKEDWVLIKELVAKYNIKTVQEFGAGLSSVLMNRYGLCVDSIENDENYFSLVSKVEKLPNRNYAPTAYDFTLVDGTSPRKGQMVQAKLTSNLVLVHDGYTPPDRQAANEVFKDWKEIKVKSVRSRVFIKE